MLSVDHVDVELSGKTILQSVDFKLEAGELMGILGANGAGKTTLARTICGLILPTRGRISLLGRTGQSFSFSPEFRKRVGLLLYPERSFYFRLTGMQNLEFFAALDGLNFNKVRRGIIDLAVEFDLVTILDRQFMKYSLGERKKLAILRLAMKSPELIILDEPTANLDQGSRDKLLNLVRTWKSDGRAVIYISHHMSDFAQLKPKTWRLEQGMLLEESPQHSSAPVSAGSLNLRLPFPLVQQLAKQVRILPGVEEVETGEGSLCISFDEARTTAAHIIAVINTYDVPLHAFSFISGSLEV